MVCSGIVILICFNVLSLRSWLFLLSGREVYDLEVDRFVFVNVCFIYIGLCGGDFVLGVYFVGYFIDGWLGMYCFC